MFPPPPADHGDPLTPPEPTRQGTKRTRREILAEAAAAGAGLAAASLLGGGSEAGASPPFQAGGSPPLQPAPGTPRPWMAGYDLYSSVVNLATGNLQIAHPVCGWSGKGGGLQLTLYFNSQSTRSSALGPKWSHSLLWRIFGTNPAIVVAGDGTETHYTLSGGQYVPPAGVFDSLVRHGDNTWTLTLKGGVQYRFRSDGLLGSIVDLNSNTITCTWTGGSLTQVTDAAGRTLSLAHSGGRLTTVTDAEGRVWTLTYDGQNRVTRITDPQLDGQSYYTQFVYGASNNVVSVRNRLSKVWQFAYGASGIATSMTDPDGRVWSIAYTNPGGGAEGAAGEGMLQSEPDPGTQPIWPLNVTVVGGATDPTGALVQYGFDGQGRLLAERDAGGSQTAYTYNSANNRTSMRLPSDALWQYAYDARGNQTQATDPRGKTTQRTFDAGDRVLTVTDPLGNVTLYDYDMRGNLIRETDPTGAATQHAYNADGSLAQTTDPAGKVTAFAYNANGHLIRVTDPLGNQSNYVWQNTRLVQRTDARGRTTSYIYDAWGRQVGVDYPAGGSADIALTLDPEGRLVQSVDGTGTRTWTYDTWGRPLTQTSPAGNTSASYDAAGRLLTQTDVTGRQIQYAYNAAKRISLVGDNVGIALYTYTADGLPTVETYPNGTQVIRNYDAAGRLTSLTHRRTSDGSTIIGYTAEYDDAGRLTQVIEQPSGDVTTFAYDAAGRLLSETRAGVRSYTGIYSYDSRGLRTFARRTEGGVLSHEGTYTYDDAGRLTQVVDAATQQTELYSWYADGTLAAYPGPGYTRLLDYDEEGRLLRIRRDHGGGNVQTAYEYAYGHDGKRRWRKDYLTNTWTRYPCGVACGAGDLVEQQSTLAGGTWQTSALCLQGLSLVRRNGEYHHFDVLSTVGAVTDAGGTVLSSDLFDAFGVLRHAQGQATTPWRWQDRKIAEEGLLAACGGGHYLPARALPVQAAPAQPVSACELNKRRPTMANCQDCCEEYLAGWLEKLAKKEDRATRDCIQDCKRRYSRPKELADCLRGCMSLGFRNINVKNYLECCYSECNIKVGHWNPPGKCKGRLP